MEFFIKKVNNKTFDCFEGTQWSTWSRLRAGAKGSVYVDNGAKLPYKLVKDLASVIDPNKSEQLVKVN